MARRERRDDPPRCPDAAHDVSSRDRNPSPERSADTLPRELEDLVRRATDRRELTAAERMEIERELTAHFEDGLRAGVSGADLVSAFGDVDLAATLMVRARRRCRHSIRRRAGVVARTAALLVVLAYGFSAWRLHATEPAFVPSRTTYAFLVRSAPVAGQNAGMGGIRQASGLLLNALYSDDGAGEGRLSAAGLRVIQTLLGKADPGVASRLLEPVLFVHPVSRAEAARELTGILDAAERRVAAREAATASLAVTQELAIRSRSIVWSIRHLPVAAIALVLSDRRAATQQGAPHPDLPL